MNGNLESKISNICVAYMDVGEGREQGRGSFVKLRNSSAIAYVSRLEPECFNQQSIRPRPNQRYLSQSDFMPYLLKVVSINFCHTGSGCQTAFICCSASATGISHFIV